MIDFKCRILKEMDIEIYENELIILMQTVLKDNIIQDYPVDLPTQYVKKLPGYIKDGSAIIAGAFSGEKLVGFSWAYELLIFGERRLHIDMICVDLLFRKKGIARQLVDMQINEAKLRGISIIEAMTTRANNNSYSWFHSLGFDDERVKVKLVLE